MSIPIFIQKKYTVDFEFSTDQGSYLVRWKEKEDLQTGKFVNIVSFHIWEKNGNNEYHWKALADTSLTITKKPSIPRSKKLLIHFI